jgi:hypothetical protein
MAASKPILSINFSPRIEILKVTCRFWLGSHKRRFCKLGKNRRLVLLLAWETLLPVRGRLPVNLHTLLILIALTAFSKGVDLYIKIFFKNQFPVLVFFL